MAKTNQLLFAFAFLVLLSVGFGSAIQVTLSPSPLELSINSNQSTLTIVNSNDVGVNITIPSARTIIDGTRIATITPSQVGSIFIENGSSAQINFSISNHQAFDFGTYSASFSFIIINSTNTSINNTQVYTINYKKSFCEGIANPGELEIRDLELNSVEGFGEDDEFWYPGDEVEVQFEVKNMGDWDIEDIEIEFCLYDQEAKECILDEGDVEIDEDGFNLDKNDEQNVLIAFGLDIDDLNEEISNYEVFVKARGKIDDNDANSFDGADSCASDSQQIDIRNNDDFAIFTNIDLPEIISCGDELIILGEVWNIGDSDQQDVSINVYNKELGINKDIAIGDIDAFSSESVEIRLNIPANATQKSHAMQIRIYDEDNDIFENDEDEEALFNVVVKVDGGSCFDTTKPTVTAALNSTAKVGEELIIRLSVKSNSAQSNAFVVSADGYSSWAEFVGIESSVMTISAQGTGVAVLKLNPTQAGQQTFNVKILYNGKTIDQPVTVTVAPSTSGLGFLNSLVDQFGKTTAYLIVAIAILIIIILLVLIIRAIIYLIRKA